MKKTQFQKIALSACIILLLIFFSGCSGIQGYGVLLWSVPEHGLSDGDVVPVYLRSNIGKIYAIGVPGSDTKIEVPLWQITEPESKRKATERAEQFEEYKYQYASVKIDGLAIREGAQNVADQIYRLRESEIVKILYKGEGEPVMRGSTPLEGDWMWVLTSDGTQGWCFSYNLDLYDEREGFQIQVVDESGENDAAVIQMAEKTWYPESYATMIAENKINLQKVRYDYGFNPGLTSGIVSAINEAINYSYPYVGITRKAHNTYTYDETPLSIIIRSEDYITVEYTDEIGRRFAYGFIAFEEVEDGATDYITEIISAETERRANQYNEIINLSDSFFSSNYGTITFSRNDSNTFTWRGYDRLADSNIEGVPSSGGSLGRGSVAINYFIADSLKSDFDGVLTLRFNTSQDELNLLYKIESNGIRFESVDSSAIDGESTVIERSVAPIVMFFNIQ